jgi:hypothetical protein
MGDLRIKALAMDVTRDVSQHWERFKEPMSLTSVQCRYLRRLERVFGVGNGFSWFIDQLKKARVLHSIETRTGKRWMVPIEAWNGLDSAARLKVDEWCQTAVDPRYERSVQLREERLKNRQPV